MSDFSPISVCDVTPTTGGHAGQRSFPSEEYPTEDAKGPISMQGFGVLGVTVKATAVKYWIRAGADPDHMEEITGVEGDLNTGGDAYEFDISLENTRNLRYLVPVPLVDILADFDSPGGGSLRVEFHRRNA